jgi:Flp pilus assembly pilin Flp
MMQQMRQRWLKPCSSLKRDERGISAVEFALTASFTMILIMGGIEFSMLTYTKHMLSLATNEASRAAKASVTLEYNELGGTAQDLAARKQARLDSFTNRLNAVMAGLPGDRLPVVRTQVFSNFNNYGQGDQLLVDSNNNKLCDAGDQYRERNGTSGFQPDPSVAAQLSLGQAGDVVRFDVEYDAPILFGFWTALLQTQAQGAPPNTVRLRESAVVRNQTLPGIIPPTVPVGSTLNC